MKKGNKIRIVNQPFGEKSYIHKNKIYGTRTYITRELG
jgi:hypothetical protein